MGGRGVATLAVGVSLGGGISVIRIIICITRSILEAG